VTLAFSADGSQSVDNMIIRKESTGILAYMVNAAEADLTDVAQVTANTLTDDFPSRDFYKPGNIYHLVLLADTNMIIELDTNRTPKRVEPVAE